MKKGSNSSKKVLIYTEASKAIGMGHLSRACLLYNFLGSSFGFIVKLVMRTDDNAEIFLHGRNVENALLPNASSDDERNTELCRLLEKEKPLLLIVDILEVDSIAPCIAFARKHGCRTIVIIDNTKRKEIDADIVLNANPAQLTQDYSTQKARYLLGPMYFIMDEAYAHTEVIKPNGNIRKILLSLGGSDHNDLLFRILKVIGQIKRDLSLIVVSSGATGYIDRLKTYIRTLPYACDIMVDVPGLVSLWEQCDLAITAGGNTLFERIASRRPGATVCQLPRQMEIADRFQTLKVNCNLGFGPELGDVALAKRLDLFIADTKAHMIQYRQAQKVVDGRGIIRLGNEITALLGEGSI